MKDSRMKVYFREEIDNQVAAQIAAGTNLDDPRMRRGYYQAVLEWSLRFGLSERATKLMRLIEAVQSEMEEGEP